MAKELRLRGIARPEDGDAYLPTFMARYNRRFAREPLSSHDVHRPIRDDEDLEQVFTWREERKLSRNLTLTYKRVTHLVDPEPGMLPIAGRQYRIHEHENGRVEICYEDGPGASFA